jgi:Endonuclease-reverse transcriptase
MNRKGCIVAGNERKFGRSGEEVLLYVRDVLLREMKEISAECESLWVNIKGVKLNDITIGICYRRPDAGQIENEELMQSIQRNIGVQTIIMGDFNFKELDWEGKNDEGSSDSILGEEFKVKMEDLFLTQHVKEPTRGNSILDLVLSTEVEMVEDMVVSVPVANSDHNTLYWDLICNTEREAKINQHYNYMQGNYKEIVKEMKRINWDEEFKEGEVEDKWNKFKFEFLNSRNRHVQKSKERKRKDKVWMSEKIRKEIKKRNKLWGELSKKTNYGNLVNYKRSRNLITGLIRKSKGEYARRNW